MAAEIRRRLRGAIEEHLASRDVTRVIYGSVIGLALVVALESHPPTAIQATVAVAATALAMGFAEAYSEIVGGEARTRRPAGPTQLRTAALEACAVSFGAGFPVVFFALAAAGAMGLDTAFTVSKWTGLGLICAYGFVAGRVSGSGVGASLLHAAAVGAIGGGLIALKALLH
jgi:hypothetical protein